MAVEPELSYLYREDRPPRFPITFVYGQRSLRTGPDRASLRLMDGARGAPRPLRAETIARSLHGRENADGFPVIEALPPIAL